MSLSNICKIFSQKQQNALCKDNKLNVVNHPTKETTFLTVNLQSTETNVSTM